MRAPLWMAIHYHDRHSWRQVTHDYSGWDQHFVTCDSG